MLFQNLTCNSIFLTLAVSTGAVAESIQAPENPDPSGRQEIKPELVKLVPRIPTAFPELFIDPLTYDEPYNAGWQIYLDNDLFISPDIDRDYTGGLAIAYSGRRAREWWFSMDRGLDWLDEWFRIQPLQTSPKGFQRHSLEFGLILFTPDDITVDTPIPDDRPYANFVFMANSQQTTFPETGWMLQSILTVGFLGLSIGPDVQSLIHSATDSAEPEGWQNQISDGGELTASYTVRAQKILLENYGRFSYEVSGALEGSIGFTTDVNVGLSTRFGKIRSPWWTFAPHQSDYINLGQTITSRIDERILPSEFFGWAGINANFGFYNAFLQGQFRDSAVELDRDELEDIVYEAWLGATKTWSNGFGLSFVTRGRTEEIKPPNGRSPLWSGFIISYAS